MSPEKPDYIIAIGASAGSLPEINSFFDHTPLDAASYVIVQDSSPEFKSWMVALLSQRRKLVVKEAKNEMRVRCKQVYLIPKDKVMTIRDSRLYLAEKEKGQASHLIINRFFNSLAADNGKKAIGVILSGLGADGAEGIRSIKKAGGMVIARNPVTTAFAGMPSNAIATGLVDLILEPCLIPSAIENYVKAEGTLLPAGKNEENKTEATNHSIKNYEFPAIDDDLHNYFRSNTNAQLFVSNDLLIIKFSPATVDHFRLAQTDIGKRISDISAKIKFETITYDIQKVLAEGGTVTREIETGNGKWYRVIIIPYILLANNKTNGAIISFNDITELKKTSQELYRMNRSLLRIIEDHDNYMHAVSHDLVAPLCTIETSIGVMNEIKVTDPGFNSCLNIINLSIKKFRCLINEMASIARLETDMIAMEMVDIDEMINEIIWALETKIKSAGAVITKDLELKHILFSKKNLRSILCNLISNSIKFKGDAPPEIHIHTSIEEEQAILTIQDNGIGISKNDFDTIFDMYGRLNRSGPGHGIGLYLVKKIVEAAGGNIVVDSEPGKGARFIICFKIEREPLPVTLKK